MAYISYTSLMYMHVCTWLSIITTQSVSIPMHIDCVTTSGSNPGLDHAQYVSTASCSSSYTLTGCGAEPVSPPTNDGFQGVYISNGQCVAISNIPFGYSGGIRAYARCCDTAWFPSSSVRSLTATKSTTEDGAVSSVNCANNEQIVGCTGEGESVAHDGSYSGDVVLFVSKQSNTFNKCNADNGWEGNGATAYSRCFDATTLSAEYSMECVTVWGDASGQWSGFGAYPTSTVSCPTTDYFMPSCAGYSAWSTLGSYNVNAANQCVARHTSSTADTFSLANAICCRILEATDNPTSDPTSSPTLKPTYSPTYIPSVSPSHNPTTIIPTTTPSDLPTTMPSDMPTTTPTVTPTLYPTIYPTDNPTIYPTFFPTLYPTIPPTQMPTLPTLSPTNTTSIPTETATMRSTEDSAISTNPNNREMERGIAASLDVTKLMLGIIVLMLILLTFIIALLLRSSRRRKRIKEAKLKNGKERKTQRETEGERQRQQKQKQQKQKQMLVALELGKTINIKYNTSMHSVSATSAARHDKFIIESDGDDLVMQVTNGKRTDDGGVRDDEFIVQSDEELVAMGGTSTKGNRVTLGGLGYDEEIEDMTDSDDEDDDICNVGTTEGDIDDIIIEGDDIQSYHNTMH